MACFRRHVKPEKFEYAKRMRENPTPAEAELWSRIKNNQLFVRFKNQAVIFGYVADFYCSAAKLVVELDGSFHANRLEYDLARSRKFASIGIATMRFRNQEIFTAIDSVVQKIQDTCIRRLSQHIESMRRKEVAKQAKKRLRRRSQ